MPVRYIVDIDDKEAIRKFKTFDSRSTEYMRLSILDSMRQIGLIAVSRFMSTAKHISPGFSIGIAGNKLNIRSGRLSRSLTAGFSFAGALGGANEGIQRITKIGNTVKGEYGTEVPYARIHEKGGTINPTITSRARGYFWSMYYQTSIPQWKYMALSKKTQFTIHIRPRPFLDPALDASRPVIERIFQNRFADLIREVESG